MKITIEVTLEEIDLIGALVASDRDRKLDNIAGGPPRARIITKQEEATVPLHQSILAKLEMSLIGKMFDYGNVRDPRFVCAHGHAMPGEYQTKDFDCVLGVVEIDERGVIAFHDQLKLGKPHTSDQLFTGVFEIYGDCETCVRAGLMKQHDLVNFQVRAVDGVVVEVTRVPWE